MKNTSQIQRITNLMYWGAGKNEHLLSKILRVFFTEMVHSNIVFKV